MMVPFGAPYYDVNNNGIYEPAIDTPGVKNAASTIFMCITDADKSSHTTSEGFGGGTEPLYAELHITAWAYDSRPDLQRIQFINWQVINKGNNVWVNPYYSIVIDPDLGDATDDYLGCDTTRSLVYCYNADNFDGNGSGITYGASPPAVGMVWLNCRNWNSGLKSFVYHYCWGCNEPECELGPLNSYEAYNFIKGYKRDGTPYVIPLTNPPVTTKFCYPGDPETGTGWTCYTGKVLNCDNSLYGELVQPVPPHDVRALLNSGKDNTILQPGQQLTIMIAQLIARGNNNKNSVTLLKQLADTAIAVCNNITIGIEPISSNVANNFVLYQNYPNPFNPKTKIKFSLPLPSKGGVYSVRLLIYDILGREVGSLIPPLWGGQEGLKPGTYEVEWDPGKSGQAGLPSGVYFYTLVVSDASASLSTIFKETKKLILLK